MARFGSLGTQYFTDDNVVLGGGSVTFYEPGTTTLKDTYSDSAMTIKNTNPVLLDAAGRLPNVFFSGLAKAVLKDSEGEIIETRDPVGDFSAGDESFSTWSADVSYSVNDVVAGSDGYFYVSRVNSNIANDPISSPTEWKLLVEQLGFDGTVNGNVYVVDTSDDQGIGNVAPNTIRALVPISTVTASNVATVDFTGLASDYDMYLVEVVKCQSETDGVNFLFKTSANNGSSFDGGASDYSYGVAFSQTPSGVTSRTGSAGVAEITLSGGAVGNDANQEYISLNMHVLRPSQVSYGTVYWDGALNAQTTGHYNIFQGVGQRRAEAAFNAIRFYFSSGNVASGIFTLYGVRRT